TRSFGQLFAALGASIVLAYLLMAVLYDSFASPIVILFSLPVAVGGAIGALWIFGYTFNIFAMIGLILLVGLAIKNGILLVDRAVQLADAAPRTDVRQRPKARDQLLGRAADAVEGAPSRFERR